MKEVRHHAFGSESLVIVYTCAADDLDATGSLLYHSLDDLEVLLLAQGGRLAGSAARHNAWGGSPASENSKHTTGDSARPHTVGVTRGALLDVPFDKLLDAGIVNLVAVGEGRHKRHVGTEELKLCHLHI